MCFSSNLIHINLDICYVFQVSKQPEEAMGRNDEIPKQPYGQYRQHKDVKLKEKEHPGVSHCKSCKYPAAHEKYKTSTSEPDKSQKVEWKKDANYTISKVQKEQYDYIRNNLYIKSAVDREKTILKFQLKKVSIRNYTPKTINQEINMGMWI